MDGNETIFTAMMRGLVLRELTALPRDEDPVMSAWLWFLTCERPEQEDEDAVGDQEAG